ncbi:MAG: lytic transglycosylase domain-containing protein [Zetaproteobacteria bacterium]|nr:lytic transglycosylase domain-containing protein [Zetaproteobacteria bacterium]
MFSFFFVSLITLSLKVMAFDGEVDHLSLAQQRQLFESYWKKSSILTDQEIDDANHLLAAYPLLPYLHLKQARLTLKASQMMRQNEHLIAQRIKEYSDIPDVRRLQTDWLHYLVSHGDYSQLSHYLSAESLADSTSVIVLQMLWHEGKRDIVFQRLSEMWLKGQEFDSALQPMVSKWKQKKHPTLDESWLRAKHFMLKGDWRRAKKTLPYLSDRAQKSLRLWIALYKHPQDLPQRWRELNHLSVAQALIIDQLVLRFISKSFEQALAFLQVNHEGVSAEKQLEWQQYLAIRAAKDSNSQAIDLLESIADDDRQNEAWSWLARGYIERQQWSKLSHCITSMPATMWQESRWQYWLARSYRAQGLDDSANDIFSALALERGYYSFLSAEALHKSIELGVKYSEVDAVVEAQLAQNIHAQRAHEWFLLNDPLRAKREWSLLLSGVDLSGRLAAAHLAADWGWHYQSIRAAWDSGARDDLSLRFPVVHLNTIELAAKKKNIPESWVLAVIRQESSFDDFAHSRVGARGLMQLMPATGKHVAKKMDEPLHSSNELFDPQRNIRLGTSYLGDLTHRFEGQLALAAAAYNAGPSRVSRWLKERPVVDDLTIWIESIPYEETRRYVQNVLAYEKIYQHQLELQRTQKAAFKQGEIARLSDE